MRITLQLCKQHLERAARYQWYLRGKRKIVGTKASEYVSSQNFEIHDAVESILKPPKPPVTFDVISVQQGPLKANRSHPEYKNDPCCIYNDSHVLLGGLKQAQVLTNSLLINHSLPQELVDKREKIQIPTQLHEELKKQILLSCVYDAEQKKLPIKKDPLRPAWVFPRDYGITDSRKNELLIRGILRICDGLMKRDDLTIVDDAKFSLPLTAHGKDMQFELTSEHLVASREALPNYPSPSSVTDQLPDLSPLHCTVSLQPQHFYNIADSYPMSSDSKWKHIHTGFLHFNPTQVSNLYDVAVNADQVAGRLLVKSFCIASCQARALCNPSNGDLLEPITVQTIQTDGRFFSTMVYQLNSLDVEGSKRNVFWMEAPMALYSVCEYNAARPTLLGYNPAVLKTILAMLSIGS